MHARGITIGSVIMRADCRIAVGFCGCILCNVPSVEGECADEEPGAHLADEHLHCLDDWLLEVFAFFGVGIIAVSYTDIILFIY